MNNIRALGLSIDISTANTINSAKTVYVFNANTTFQTVTIANSTANTGSIVVGANSYVILSKPADNTIQGTTCKATAVSVI